MRKICYTYRPVGNASLRTGESKQKDEHFCIGTDFFVKIHISIVLFQIHVDDETLPAEFSIQIKEASTEVWMDETTYQVEFETRIELKSKVAWFLHHMNQKYPVVCKYFYLTDLLHCNVSHPDVIYCIRHMQF